MPTSSIDWSAVRAAAGFRLAVRRTPSAGRIGERLGGVKVHDEVRTARSDSGVDDADEVRMVETAHRRDFALEALDQIRDAGQRVVQELERDLPLRARVFALIDDSHSARAQAFVEPIPARDRAAELGVGYVHSSAHHDVIDGTSGTSVRTLTSGSGYLPDFASAACAMSSGSMGSSDRSGSKMISMRRFSFRPTGVAFLAFGSNSP